MAGSVDIQLRNAQSSILFMQQEHAKTLQGLHAELQKLQKKCAELTFELAMKSEDIDEEQYKEQQQELESRLEKKEKEVNQLHGELEQRDEKIVHLEEQLKLQEKKLLSRAKHHEHQISSLNSELDKKSANIAYLTNQLRQMAVIKHKAADHAGNIMVHPTSPQPPKKPLPPHRRKIRTPSMESVSTLKNGRITTTLSDTFDGKPIVDHISRQNRRLSSPAISRSYDDREVSAFVAKVDRTTSDIEIKPAPPILPPISPFPQERRSNSSPYYTRRALRLSKQRDSEPAEVSSLAIQGLHRRKKDVPATEQSNGDSP